MYLFDRFNACLSFGKLGRMSLYLKYRPKTIDELDLGDVRKILFEIVKSGKMAHAYLLTGPRGSGKTSTARIMARLANCLNKNSGTDAPCGECEACKSILEGRAVDVIELDGASNRRIDDVRELKEKIRLAPTVLKTKVYIIDEVHMLTTEAFNALLKTLEEPPSHSLFILATTEAHKVPETIVSRCVLIKFGKANNAEMERSLLRVVKGEEGEIEPQALALLAGAVDGSFRDGVKLLEQALASGGKVSLGQIQELTTGSRGWSSEPLAQALIQKELEQALELLRGATSAGVELLYLTGELMRVLGTKVREGELELISLIYKLDEAASRLATSPVPELLLEIVIIEWCGGAHSKSSGPTKTPTTKKLEQKTKSKEETKVKSEEVGKLWGQLVEGLLTESVAMGTLLAKVTPATIQGDELVLEVRYDFHREQLMQPKTRQRIEQMASQALGRPVRMLCKIGEGTRPLNSQPLVDNIGDESLDFDEAQAIFVEN